MNPSREEALFALALEKPADKRPAFLDAMCEGARASWWTGRGAATASSAAASGSGWTAEEADIPSPMPDDDLLALDEALAKFAALDARKAELVKLRYFAGLTFEEAAGVLGIAVPTAKQWWAYARAWLRVEMTGAGSGGPPVR